MKIYESENAVIIENLCDFDPEHTFDCGQCFRWENDGEGRFTGVAFGKVLRVWVEGNKTIFENMNLADFEKIWVKYFDLERDYGEVKEKVSVDDTMKCATEFGWGIRILHQDFFETLLSFIISQRNGIPRIKTVIKRISEKWGTPIEFGGEVYYSFPTADQLKNATVEDFAKLGTGYRDKYLYAAVQSVLHGKLCEKELEKLNAKEARDELLKQYGIGNKVADCILLFGLHKFDSFPVDVWIKRVMEEYYLGQSGENLFGDFSGFAQQYLFFWRRSL